MHTEDEARTKWCPFSNVYVPYQSTGAAGNRGLASSDRGHGNEAQTRCIASQCMAWQWDRTPLNAELARAWVLAQDRETNGAFIESIKLHRAVTRSTLSEAKNWADAVRDGRIPKPPVERAGFCGLAGRP